jgi:CubicO group peptidase (beta-lactamase class C family)
VFTDALEMKGVTKYFPGGEASVQALIAGNDMLCLPESVPQTIEAVKKAIAEGRLTWVQVNNKCIRVLEAKYQYVVGKTSAIDTANLIADLNKDIPLLRTQVAQKALTILAAEPGILPLKTVAAKTTKTKLAPQKILYIAAGADSANQISSRLKASYNADVIILPYADSTAIANFDTAGLKKYSRVIVGLHRITRSPAKNFGIPAGIISLVNGIQSGQNTVVLTFGNPYANKFFAGAKNLIACYEDDSVFQNVAADLLAGKIMAQGTLPVTVGAFAFGSGIIKNKAGYLANADSAGLQPDVLSGIDSIALEAIKAKATPGCVVTVLRNGKLAYQKAFGTLAYDIAIPVTVNTIYDLASVTKISATTVAVMKLVEEGKINVKDAVSKYLPWLKNSNKQNILIENLLLHQAGLNPFIPFYKEIIDRNGNPLPSVTSPYKKTAFTTPVSNALFLRNNWPDTMFERIKQSAVADNELKYVYSDNDFILLGKVVEAVSGKTLDEYVTSNFYEPLGMTTTRFKVFEKFSADNIAPTENEKFFRNGLIWSYVHDPGAAMFNNVSGHAGLFSNGADLSKLYQMLLNGGMYDGRRYLKKETIDWFTSYQTPVSRRGLGFDKPEKDNNMRSAEKAYPSKSVSPLTFGHTGFTGTCVWVDPKYNLIYIFLSNRVNPSMDNNGLSQLSIRSRIQEVIYKAIK